MAFYDRLVEARPRGIPDQFQTSAGLEERKTLTADRTDGGPGSSKLEKNRKTLEGGEEGMNGSETRVQRTKNRAPAAESAITNARCHKRMAIEDCGRNGTSRAQRGALSRDPDEGTRDGAPTKGAVARLRHRPMDSIGKRQSSAYKIPKKNRVDTASPPAARSSTGDGGISTLNTHSPVALVTANIGGMWTTPSRGESSRHSPCTGPQR